MATAVLLLGSRPPWLYLSPNASTPPDSVLPIFPSMLVLQWGQRNVLVLSYFSCCKAGSNDFQTPPCWRQKNTQASCQVGYGGEEKITLIGDCLADDDQKSCSLYTVFVGCKHYLVWEKQSITHTPLAWFWSQGPKQSIIPITRWNSQHRELLVSKWLCPSELPKGNLETNTFEMDHFYSVVS